MKSLFTFSLLLFPVFVSAQFAIECGYQYLNDHALSRRFKGANKRNPYAHNHFAIGGNYLFKGWEFGMDFSMTLNRHHFYGTRSSSYYDSGVGGSTSQYYEWRTRGEAEYAYAGMRLSAEKWFDFKRASWLHLGLGLFQHADFLVDYRQRNVQQQTYKQTEMYFSSTGNTSTTVQESEWQDQAIDLYSMRKEFFYAGWNFSLRFQLKSWYAEPSLSVSYTHIPRGDSRHDEFIYDGSDKFGYPSRPMLLFGGTFYRMPACSLKVGYRFGGKKTE